MQRFPRTRTQVVFDAAIEPIGSVRPGETFQVETADSLCGLIKSERDVFQDIEDILERIPGANPVTGPIYVQGARAGDCIAVSIVKIVPAPRTHTGWTAIIPGWGGLTHDMGYTLQDALPPHTAICAVRNGAITMPIDGREVTIPSTPLVGTIGVAPGKERRLTFSQSPEYFGDCDITALGAGSRVILPVHVDGALLSLGDVHAAQGDGEITGVAIEVEAEVTLRVDVLSRQDAAYGRLPVLETADRVGVVAGLMGISLTSCIRAGYVDLCRRLEYYHGFSREGAYMLLGQVGRVEVGNLIDPFYSCFVSMERRYLE